MEHTKIIFSSCHEDDNSELACYSTIHNDIFIVVGTDLSSINESHAINLNRDTAIKLSKVLKSEIAKLDKI